MMRSILEEETALELQHINVKLLLENPDGLDFEALINVFHSWIQEQVFEELLLDVADYRHVHNGPGIVLISHEADYAVDNTDGRWGIRYNRKAPVAGSNQDRLTQVVRATLIAAARLQQDTRLNGRCNFNGQDIELIINDRQLAPNTHETRQASEPELRSFFDALFGEGSYQLEFETSARKLFGVRIRSQQRLATSDLLQNLTQRPSPSYDVI
jgi:hypothetical protein